MKAIILAAGVGSRIKKFSLKKHKSLIKIGNKSLLKRIVDYLIDINIKDILIVTGHKSEQIKNVLGYSSRGEVIHTNNMVISENE